MTRRRTVLPRTLASVCVAVVITMMAVPAERASAADNGLWSIFPTTGPGHVTARAFFQPVLAPGVTLHDSVTITNKTTQRMHFNLYAADAFNAPNGGFALRNRTDPKRDIGAWIRLPAKAVVLAAGQSVDLPFSITPPANATPGDHAGGIVVENTQSVISRRGQIDVRQIYAVATRVYGRVIGPLHPQLGITNLQLSTQLGGTGLVGAGVHGTVEYSVVNVGNVRLQSTATVSVAPLIGGSTQLAPTRLPELLPGGSVTVRQSFHGVRPWGRLSARVVLTSTAPPTTAVTDRFVFPWLLLVPLAIAIGLLWWLVHRRRRLPATRREVEPDQARRSEKVA